MAGGEYCELRLIRIKKFCVLIFCTSGLWWVLDLSRVFVSGWVFVLFRIFINYFTDMWESENRCTST